jgi:hypothetical protein
VVARDRDRVGAGSLATSDGGLGAARRGDLGVLDTVGAILIVVTHLGSLGARSVTGGVYGLFGDLEVRLVKGGARSDGSVDGGLNYAGGLLEVGEVAGSLDGDVVEVGGLGEGGAVAGDVDSGAGVGDFVLVVGLETGTVLALSNVDDGVVRSVVVIELDTRFGEGGLGSAALLTEILLLDAGTAVFTGDADLFLDASLLTGRDFDVGLERVLTFPSGVRGRFDLQLLVDVGLGSRGLSFPV